MRNWSVSRQLTAVIATFVAAALISVAAFTCLTRAASSSNERFTADTRAARETATSLIDAATGLESGLQKMLREKDPDVLEKLVNDQKRLAAVARERVRTAAQTVPALGADLEKLVSANAKSQDALLLGDHALAQQHYIELSNPALEALLGRIFAFEKQRTGELEAETAQSAATLIGLRVAVYVVVLAGVGFATILGFVLLRRIVGALGHVADALGESSQAVSGGAGQIESASRSLAEGSSRQAASLEQISSSLAEIGSTVRSSTATARRARELSSATHAAAGQGAGTMQQMNEAMNELQRSSSQVSKIIRTIDEIAFQTNILALNAAVEAARAGEAGMGFAVVAGEVRNLAQRAADAARETAHLIEDSTAKTARSLSMSATIREILDDIGGKAEQMDRLVSEVATAYDEQARGIEQISSAMAQSDQDVQNAAAQSQESAATAKMLTGHAGRLQECVEELNAVVDGVRN
jgi:methyl-accepting chemotaxis protein